MLALITPSSSLAGFFSRRGRWGRPQSPGYEGVIPTRNSSSSSVQQHKSNCAIFCVQFDIFHNSVPKITFIQGLDAGWNPQRERKSLEENVFVIWMYPGRADRPEEAYNSLELISADTLSGAESLQPLSHPVRPLLVVPGHGDKGTRKRARSPDKSPMDVRLSR